MSSETEPTQPAPDSGQEPGTQPEPPVEQDPTVDPEPEEEEQETPPPPDAPTAPVQVDPATYYEVESVCTTGTCLNLNTTTTEPQVYSNAGTIRMICGLCGKDRKILSATRLDPQPEVS